MKDDQRNYILVGAFVLAALATLFVWLALISGRTGSTDSYFVVYDNVMGLQTGTQILFEGYPIGFIDSIEPLKDPGRQLFRVDVSVKQGWPIPADSLARITAPGLLSAFAIDIQAGESATVLTPGSRIRGLSALAVLDVVAQVNDLLREKIEPWLTEMASGTLSISNNLESFTADLGETMKRIDALMNEGNVSRVDQILVNLDTSTANFAAVIDEFGDTRRNIDQLIRNLDQTVELSRGDLTQAVADARFSLEALSRYIESIAYNLDATMRNMNEFSLQLRENPGVLVRGRASDAAEGN